MSKLLLLGLDGGDVNYIRSRSSVLPCLASKLDSSKLLTLETPKALSGSVWPTFYNGVNPGEHGVYQHLIWDAKKMAVRLIGDDWCYSQPFWQEIEKLNKKVMVLDIPYSFPNTLKQGVQITDWGSHGQTFPTSCNCPQAQAILDKIGKSPIGRETPIQKTPRQLQNIQQSLLESADLKGKLIQELMSNIDYDLFIAVFAETHRGGHAFFGDKDEQDFNGEITPLLKIYQAVDRAIEKIIANGDEDTQVIIFSVHGMARDYSQGHIIRPVMDKINEVFLEKYCQISPRPNKVKANSIVPYLRKVVPYQLQYAVGAVAPDFVRRWVVEKEIIGGLDWSRTPCFVLRSDLRTELRYNLIGRESEGFLEANSSLHQQYIKFCREVLFSLEDGDTKEKLVDDLIDTHEEFFGENCDGLPDLVICWLRGKPLVKSVYSPHIGHIGVIEQTLKI